jgi:hypothetical protein
VEVPRRLTVADVPAEFGSSKGAYSRFRQWTLDGTWQRLVSLVQADADAARELDWLVTAVDSTVVRAHQHAAGLRKRDTTDATNPPTAVSAARAVAGAPTFTWPPSRGAGR